MIRYLAWLLLAIPAIGFAQSQNTYPPGTVGCVPITATTYSPLAGCVASGSGAPLEQVSPTLVAPILGTPTSGDGLNLIDIQANALVGPVPKTNLYGSMPRYPNSATVTITSADLGNIVANCYAGSATATVPAINTSSITPNAFQFGIINASTASCTTQTLTITPTSPTTVNELTSLTLAAGASAFFFADNNTSGSGNYNYVAFVSSGGASGAGLGANTFTGAQTVSYGAPSVYLQDTAQSGTNISDWGFSLITGTNGQMCWSALKDGFTTGGTNAICATRGASGSSSGQGVTTMTYGNTASNTVHNFLGGSVKASQFIANGVFATPVSGQGWIDQPASHQLGFGTDTTLAAYFDGLQNLNLYQIITSRIQAQSQSYPVITLSGGNCSGNDTTGNLVSSTLTFGSSTITATNTLANGQQIVFTTANGVPPLPYVINQIYYVISDSGSNYQLSLISGGASVGNVTGTTGTVNAVIFNGNFNHTGGTMNSWFTLPSSGTYSSGSCTMTATWPTAQPTGYQCFWHDEGNGTSTPALMTPSGHGAYTSTAAKLTAPTALDVIGLQCGGG